MKFFLLYLGGYGTASMEFAALNHIEPGKLTEFDTDLILTSLGFESRNTNIPRILENIHCRKIALSGNLIPRVYSYEKNREYYLENGYEITEVQGESPDFDSIFEKVTGRDLRLICDCTSMPRKWYYELFSWFSEEQDRFDSVIVRLAYTMAGYVDPGSPLKVRRIRDFSDSERRNGNGKKKALILGLGHEENMSDSIRKLVKPDLLYLFYADPPADKRFVEKLFVNNHSLIQETPIRNLVAYPIRNGQEIYQDLADRILPLRKDYTVQLIPQGPKIFSVASMLIHFSYPDTIISFPELKKNPPLDRQSFDEPVVLDIRFEGEE